jgi:hypothetical protein
MLGPTRAWGRCAQARRGSENDPRPGVERAAAVPTAALVETWTSLAGVDLDLGAPGVGPPTACPGWSVQARFPHLIGIERMLLDGDRSHLERALGEHVKNDLAASLEPWVPVRHSLEGEDCGRVGGAHAHRDAVGPRPHAPGVGAGDGGQVDAAGGVGVAGDAVLARPSSIR